MLKRMNFVKRVTEWVATHSREDCWEWPGYRVDGYGVVGANIDERGARRWFAHRAAYTVLVGPVSPDLELDHLCRNRGCFNPWHLEPVTPRTNALRSESPVAKHAKKTHCHRGHEFTPENTRVMKSRYGTTGRHCRTCEREVWLPAENARNRKFGPRGQWTHCKRGHEFTTENTIWKDDGTRRTCRMCARVSWRRFAAKKRQERVA